MLKLKRKLFGAGTVFTLVFETGRTYFLGAQK